MGIENTKSTFFRFSFCTIIKTLVCGPVVELHKNCKTGEKITKQNKTNKETNNKKKHENDKIHILY